MEKYGLSFFEYMHGTNFVNIDMMQADNPRMLTEDEKKRRKVMKYTIKPKTAKEQEHELSKMFDFE